MKEHEIYMLSIEEAEQACQQGLITLMDVLKRIMFESDPYPVLFANLPFDQALNISLKLAKEEIDRKINWDISWAGIKLRDVYPLNTASCAIEFKNPTRGENK